MSKQVANSSSHVGSETIPDIYKRINNNITTKFSVLASAEFPAGYDSIIDGEESGAEDDDRMEETQKIKHILTRTLQGIYQ